MLTLFISFTHSSDVTWPHPQTPQTPRLPALANPVPLCCGDHLVWGGGVLGSGQGAKGSSVLDQASVSRPNLQGPAGWGEPRAAPPVASGSHYRSLSCSSRPPLPNPFQHRFWFFSGDALPPPTSLHTSERPAWSLAGQAGQARRVGV